MNRKYLLYEVDFKMNATEFQKAFDNFRKVFEGIEEINVKRMDDITDAFFEFDLGVVQDDENNIVAFEPIDNEMPDWFFMFLYSIARCIEERSRLSIMYEDGLKREYSFFDGKCFEYQNKDESRLPDHEITEAEENAKADYMLLDRCRCDCDYFLGYGNRNEKVIWGGNVAEHIKKMKELYCSLPVKPIWLTMRRIEEYERLMKMEKENRND